MRIRDVIENELAKHLATLNIQLTTDNLRALFNKVTQIVFDNFKNFTAVSVTDSALNWLSAQYFKSIKVDSDQFIDDYVVFNDIPLSELTDSDIRTLSNLFSATIFGQFLTEEKQRRIENAKSTESL
jgi:hypothetical protein